jgi:hypothetical protein
MTGDQAAAAWLAQVEQRPPTLARKLRHDQHAVDHARRAGATRMEQDTLSRQATADRADTQERRCRPLPLDPLTVAEERAAVLAPGGATPLSAVGWAALVAAAQPNRATS